MKEIKVYKKFNHELLNLIEQYDKEFVAKVLLDGGFNVIEEVAVLKSYIQDDNEKSSCDLVFDIVQDVNDQITSLGFYVIKERDKAKTWYFDEFAEANEFWVSEVMKLEKNK